MRNPISSVPTTAAAQPTANQVTGEDSCSRLPPLKTRPLTTIIMTKASPRMIREVFTMLFPARVPVSRNAGRKDTAMIITNIRGMTAVQGS